MLIPKRDEHLAPEQWFFNLLEVALADAEAHHNNPGLRARIVDRYMRLLYAGNYGSLTTHVAMGADDPQYESPLQFVKRMVDYEYGDGPCPEPIWETLFGDAKPFPLK